MYIKRKFCDQIVPIELTPEEIYEAYLTQQHSFDVSDMMEYLESEGYDTSEIADVFKHGLANSLREKLNKDVEKMKAMEEVEDEHMNVLSYYEEE